MSSMADRFRELSDAVPIPRPWSLDAYVAVVAEYRKRPITLAPMDTSGLGGTGCGTGSGLWIARHDDDIIVYDRDTSPWHAQHIVLHEVGHMLLDHGQQHTGQPDAVGSDALSRLLPSISLDSVRRVLGRDAYGDDYERDAEAFADAAMLHATQPPPPNSSMRRTFFRGRRR
ncbi:hypothetical protein [Nocardia iowensis]|uniref:IrrE N-terminal-like domain-containing protein n=1 Tax=Nocardia iowensis TaxID=204891 RepID=A0ABX8RFY8_NOCIO|nr:hypothetical protein [Nocardia iowensis]QXN88524.1 hypothetical protein KV110_23295 [Nocardia iowensis]